jgi:hypothetical protein
VQRKQNSKEHEEHVNLFEEFFEVFESLPEQSGFGHHRKFGFFSLSFFFLKFECFSESDEGRILEINSGETSKGQPGFGHGMKSTWPSVIFNSR